MLDVLVGRGPGGPECGRICINPGILGPPDSLPHPSRHFPLTTHPGSTGGSGLRGRSGVGLISFSTSSTPKVEFPMSFGAHLWGSLWTILALGPHRNWGGAAAGLRSLVRAVVKVWIISGGGLQGVFFLHHFPTSQSRISSARFSPWQSPS